MRCETIIILLYAAIGTHPNISLYMYVIIAGM